MAITSIGYDGLMPEGSWRKLAPYLGKPAHVTSSTAWKVTGVTGLDRTSRVAVGSGYASGILDTSDTTYDVQHDVVTGATGTVRWDAVVMRRSTAGAGGSSVFGIVKGSATRAVPTLATDVTVTDEQLLALVQLTAGTQAPTTVIDCRLDAKGYAYDRTAATLLGVRQVDKAAAPMSLPGAVTGFGATPTIERRDGIVYLTGGVQRTSTTSPNFSADAFVTIANPVGVGMMPPHTWRQSVQGFGSTAGRIEVNGTTGLVSAIMATPVPWITLDGIFWPAAG